MKHQFINAAVVECYLISVSECFRYAYDSFCDMRMTEDNFDVDKVIFKHFSNQGFAYEQLPLLRAILTAIFANYSQTDFPDPDAHLEFPEPDFDEFYEEEDEEDEQVQLTLPFEW
ncbi:hypothetical protein [Pseudoalteromonas sp. T1lg22]|uniref:hypothetical protein n=1 Tax=Pseudoalteromonas sp. T1lg22 TaxID=2077096 RepID=UPI000CF6285A|nr:hypothetical protein [Pseudoalteromonas sp. T1lg22]